MLLAGFGVLKGGNMSCLTEVFMYFASVLMVQARISGPEWLKTNRLDTLSSLNSGLWFERGFFYSCHL